MDSTSALYQTILEGRFEIGSMPEISQVTIPIVQQTGRSPLDLTAPVRLIGREQEMALLEGCWRQVKNKCGSLVLIAGEVGVGKTRVVDEFASHLRWQGSRVLRGCCYEFERALPYQPIAEALQTCLPSITNFDLANLHEWVLREVARLAPNTLRLLVANDGPSIHRRKATQEPVPELPAAPGVDPQQARLFEAVTCVMAELSA